MTATSRAEEGLRMARASEVDPERLGVFLRRSFGVAKGEFLLRWGAWWHRGDENRWVLLDGETIAGYSGVIPVLCRVGGRAREALWWVDLVIAPAYRGRGLQTRFDDLVRGRGALILGFPNALAAKIHRHHGWGVREDLRTMLLPLDPRRMPPIRRATGLRGVLLRAAAQAARPAAALWRSEMARKGSRRPEPLRRTTDPDFDELAALAAREVEEPAGEQIVTTIRDADFLRWRYGPEGPHQHIVYLAGDPARAALVVRRTAAGAERWLDLFGALRDRDLLASLVSHAAAESVRAGCAQITCLAANEGLAAALRRGGFVVSSTARFCWLDADRETMQAIQSSTHHWGLGDSDNDDPAIESTENESR